MIEQATPLDALSLAELHALAIRDGFLVRLGTGFLKSLYSFLIRNEIVLVERVDNELLGFVSGSIRPDGMMVKFLILCPVCLFKIAFKSLRNPTLFRSILETYKVPEKSKSVRLDEAEIKLPDTELLSVAVHPDFQQMQTGTRLVQAFEQRLSGLGVRKYKAIAVESMTDANRFLVKTGFDLVSKVSIHNGILSNIYIKELIGPAYPKFKKNIS